MRAQTEPTPALSVSNDPWSWWPSIVGIYCLGPWARLLNISHVIRYGDRHSGMLGVKHVLRPTGDGLFDEVASFFNEGYAIYGWDPVRFTPVDAEEGEFLPHAVLRSPELCNLLIEQAHAGAKLQFFESTPGVDALEAHLRTMAPDLNGCMLTPGYQAARVANDKIMLRELMYGDEGFTPHAITSGSLHATGSVAWHALRYGRAMARRPDLASGGGTISFRRSDLLRLGAMRKWYNFCREHGAEHQLLVEQHVGSHVPLSMQYMVMDSHPHELYMTGQFMGRDDYGDFTAHQGNRIPAQDDKHLRCLFPMSWNQAQCESAVRQMRALARRVLKRVIEQGYRNGVIGLDFMAVCSPSGRVIVYLCELGGRLTGSSPGFGSKQRSDQQRRAVGKGESCVIVLNCSLKDARAGGWRQVMDELGTLNYSSSTCRGIVLSLVSAAQDGKIILHAVGDDNSQAQHYIQRAREVLGVKPMELTGWLVGQQYQL